jgi:hypothetical protein
VLAHQGAADESLGIALLLGALWVGWIGWSRLRGKGFPRLPPAAAGALLAVALGLLVAAVTVPPALFPTRASTTPSAAPPGPRPASTAALSFMEPMNGARVSGDELEVVLDLRGAHVVEATTTTLTPDTGHIHLSLDGRLVSMTYGTVQLVDLRGLDPGTHGLVAEFVAADHGPFDPRVVATVTFDLQGT